MSAYNSSDHMWQFNRQLYHKFFVFLHRLDNRRLFSALTLFSLVFLYPGHNRLQTLILNPGQVLSYNLDVPITSLYPQNDGTLDPYVSAQAVVVQDAKSKALLYAKSPDTLVLPASTTKIMTALIALDTWTDLETVITVQNEDRALGQTINLIKGEQLTVQNLLYGLLVHSGNDVALALADNYCAPKAKGEVGPCGYDAFVSAMNAKAQALHLDHTVFKNPSGIEQYGHVTTARDLAILAGIALKNPLIAEIVATKSKVITDVTGEIVHPLHTTNELLGVLPGLKGIKTGWTEHAGECLVSVVERDGHTLVIVVMNSLDRFADTATLVEWAFAHHDWITPVL